MKLEDTIKRAIDQVSRTAARAIAKVTNQATRYSTQKELEAAYTEVIVTHNRTLAALRNALEVVRENDQ